MLFFGLDNNQLNSNTSYLNEIEDISKITHTETKSIKKEDVKKIQLKKKIYIINNNEELIIQKIQKSRKYKYKKLIRKLDKIKNS
tara:strand:- start:347 stop:601 length:255 start_codon:yes stop_codon:yes gene_type:complete